MTVHTCRVCGIPLATSPLLHFDNMPGAAQNFPSASDLSTDSGSPLTVYQCPGCGLVQLDSEPVTYYREVIRAAACSEVIKEFKYNQFRCFIDRFRLKGKKFLEIGCGRGEFLSILNSLDVSAYGLEYSPSAVEACRAQGLDVVRGYPESGFKDERGNFDAFALLMFLEHMPEPNVALQWICRHLGPGAVGIVEVPNFDMMLRNNLFSEFISDHLLYFSADTLRTVLTLNGFEVLECSELRDDYVISAIVRKRSILDISEFYDCKTRICNEINSYIDNSGTVAVWGAGHQALAIIAMAGLENKLKYVVDSAPFKQNKFTPATHLRVVAPEILKTEPVDAVIVMAASYSDEVAGILRERFGDKFKVAILRETGLEIIDGII